MSNQADLSVLKASLVTSLYSLAKAAHESSNAVLNILDALELGQESVVGSAAASSLQDLAEQITRSTADALNGVVALDTDAAALGVVAPASITKVTKAPATSKAAKEKANKRSVAASAPNDGASDADTEGPVKKKRKAAPKDPNAPSKPLTMYFAFARDMRPKIQKERESKGLTPLNSNEVTSLVAERWKTLSEEAKQPYKDAYKAEWEVYTKALKDYKAGLTTSSTTSTGSAATNGHSVSAAEAIPAPAEVREPESPVVAKSTSVAVDSPKKKDKEKEKEKKKKKDKKHKEKEKDKSRSEWPGSSPLRL